MRQTPYWRGIQLVQTFRLHRSGTAFAYRRANKQAMMPLRNTEPSLCMNCVHSGHCVFERTSPTAVLQCDEHLVKTSAPAPVQVAPQAATNRTAPTGLCMNCDHVRTCGLRSPERIVLHCEHYE